MCFSGNWVSAPVSSIEFPLKIIGSILKLIYKTKTYSVERTAFFWYIWCTARKVHWISVPGKPFTVSNIHWWRRNFSTNRLSVLYLCIKWLRRSTKYWRSCWSFVYTSMSLNEDFRWFMRNLKIFVTNTIIQKEVVNGNLITLTE